MLCQKFILTLGHFKIFLQIIVWKKKTRKKATKQLFHKTLRTVEIILPSVALKSEFTFSVKKQWAAVRTINSLMIDPAQKCFHFPSLKQKETHNLNPVVFILGYPGIFCWHYKKLWRMSKIFYIRIIYTKMMLYRHNPWPRI